MVADLVVKTSDVRAEMKVSEIAKLLGITRDAVYKWPEFVPDTQSYKLIHARPTLPHKYVKS